jgi:hypothetical protein
MSSHKFEGRFAIALSAMLAGWSVAATAAPDVCSVLTGEEVAGALGDEFMAPDRTVVPAGPYKGAFSSCSYTGKEMTFEIKQQQFPTELGRDANLKFLSARYTKNGLALKVADLGDQAWYLNNVLDVVRGGYEYHFAVYPTAPARYHVEHQAQLTALAKLYLGR